MQLKIESYTFGLFEVSTTKVSIIHNKKKPHLKSFRDHSTFPFIISPSSFSFTPKYSTYSLFIYFFSLSFFIYVFIPKFLIDKLFFSESSLNLKVLNEITFGINFNFARCVVWSFHMKSQNDRQHDPHLWHSNIDFKVLCLLLSHPAARLIKMSANIFKIFNCKLS